MWTMGANGWIKYGWGPSLNSEWETGDCLVIDFTNNGNPITACPPLIAAHNTIGHIVDNYPAPYSLMCSGGVDSQAMLWAWHTSDHPFEVVSIKYISNGVWYNEHDLSTLVEFTNKHNIPVTYKEFDIISFLENSELHNISSINTCFSPHICTYIKMSEQVTSGSKIFSGNWLSSVGHPSLDYAILGLSRYADSRNDIVPFFFVHSAELAHAFRNMRYKHSYRDKITGYQENGFPVIPQADKMTGFENIKEYYDQFNSTVSKKIKVLYACRASNRVFDLLFRYSLEKQSKFHNIVSPVLPLIGKI